LPLAIARIDFSSFYNPDVFRHGLKLQIYCYTTASKQLESTGLDKPEIKDVATSLFIQATRHFNI
jgi:hypothetical protein